jgi:hypothetical protein
VEDRQFDTLVRGLAAGTSRRTGLRLLAGAGAALVALARGRDSGVLARRGTAGPGDPCRTDSQCVGADAPLVCDWNGYGNGTNCCTYEGSRCGFDAACCGTALCIGDYCASQSPSSCTGVGCACTTGTYSPCDYGLSCCAIYSGMAGGAGVCQYYC